MDIDANRARGTADTPHVGSITGGVQLQVRRGIGAITTWEGFKAASAMSRLEGVLRRARDMVTTRSSSGWRMTSKVLRLNSGVHRERGPPLCDSEISLGPADSLSHQTTSVAKWCDEATEMDAEPQRLTRLQSTENTVDAGCFDRLTAVNGGNMVGAVWRASSCPTRAARASRGYVPQRRRSSERVWPCPDRGRR